MQSYQTVLDFWFREIEPASWFKKDAAFDRSLRERFGALWQSASQGELEHWRVDIHGRLAEIIVLDQFSRNLFRDSALAFSCDGMALILAQEAIRTGRTPELEPEACNFLYMPFMHSESLMIHVQAEKLFRELNYGNSLEYALRHKAIIERFGRYPHRNAVLGRMSTAEELAFLQQPGSAF